MILTSWKIRSSFVRLLSVYRRRNYPDSLSLISSLGSPSSQSTSPLSSLSLLDHQPQHPLSFPHHSSTNSAVTLSIQPSWLKLWSVQTSSHFPRRCICVLWMQPPPRHEPTSAPIAALQLPGGSCAQLSPPTLSPKFLSCCMNAHFPEFAQGVRDPPSPSAGSFATFRS